MDEISDLRQDGSWASVSTNLLIAELRKRQDDGERPECGSRNRGWYDTAAHVFALLLILALSTLACAFPLISKRTTQGRSQNAIVFYCQHAGTGVLLATAFVHLLPTAFENLTDPCLPYFFSKGYKPLPGLIAMVSALIVVAVESYLTARGAGHSHSHAHDYWEEDGDHMHDAQELRGGLAGDQGRARRNGSVSRGHRPVDITLEDVEATQGLVAGVSPFPESRPAATNASKAQGEEEFDDGESDLDLEIDELNASSSSRRTSGRYASLKPSQPTDAIPEPEPRSPEEQKRQMLQCLLLEAGILFHSVFIGMAISVATGPAFVVFLVAISFHQSFEGLALGSRIAAIQFPKHSFRPWLMVLAYGFTTPIGQAIGLIVHKMYDPQSMGGLLVVGVMNAISAGLLLYAGLVQLLAEDFLTEKSYKVLKGRRRLHAFLAVIAGAVLMALVGTFA